MTDDVFQVQRDSTLCGMCGARLWQVTPVEDGRVVVEATLYQCPWCPQASPESPAETDTTPATAVVGARVRPEDRDGLACCLPVPVALAEQRAAHDERVAADAAAYEQRHGGAQ